MIRKVYIFVISIESSGIYYDVVHSKTKCKIKLYLGKDKIWIWCTAKLLIHYNFLSVLNENGIKSVEDANDEIDQLKNEFRSLWNEYRGWVERHDKAFTAVMENDKNRRKEYNLIDMNLDEIKQLIISEEKLIKEYDIK